MPLPSPDPPMQQIAGAQRPIVCYFARDLFFGVRLAEGLARVDADARPFPAVLETTALQDAALALVDLSAPVTQWQPLIQAARAAGVPVLAFGSHMDQERWRLARAVGATKIVANSQLMSHFPELVRQVIRTAAPRSHEPHPLVR